MTGKSQRGTALIEFVLVLTLFLTVTFAAVDWGWYFLVREVAINATRQGARAGSVATTPALAQSVAQSSVSNYLKASLGATYAGSPTATTGACAGTTFQCVTVTLAGYPTVPAHSTKSITGLNAWTRVPTTITVQAQMRLENQ